MIMTRQFQSTVRLLIATIAVAGLVLSAWPPQAQLRPQV